MIIVNNESTLREYWDRVKDNWGWLYMVQTRNLSMDFIREFKDRFDNMNWDDVFLYQDNLTLKLLNEIIDYPNSINLLESRLNLDEYLREKCLYKIKDM